MGNQQTRYHKDRVESLQQVSVIPNSSDINHFDIENIFIIWLEIFIDNRINHDDAVQLRRRLRHVFPHIQSFCDFQKCINHIKNAELNHNQRFILISNGPIIRSRIMAFYNIPSVALIYFCVYSENHINYNWIHANDDKLRGIFNKTDLLYDQLLNDLQVNNNKEFQSLPITVFNNKSIETSTHMINADYLWVQLLIELLINMSHTEQAKEEMLNECRLAYQNDEKGLEAIELFRSTYKSEQVIKWYTADSFIYRLLNRTLRYHENFDNVFKFRYFIADLHRQLKRIQRNFNVTTMYRGQMINKHELNMFKENRGKCISVNTFLSTTLDEAVARCYAGNGEERPKLESVLFVINIDNSITDVKPFASLKDDTHFQDEEEVLFSIGSLFEISEHIDLIPGTNIWKIELKLSGIQNQLVVNLMNHFMDEIHYDIKDIVLGKFLIYMGKYKEAESYFKYIYHQYTDGNQSLFYLVELIMGLGLAFYSQANYIQAENLYMIAHKYEKYQTHLSYLKCRNQLGKLHLNKKCYDIAACEFDYVMSSLQYYKQKNEKKYHLLLAETYINIASLHLGADSSYEFESKKVFELLCLTREIYEKILPEHHPLFAELYYYFGWTYFIENNNDVRALESLQHAMDIQILSLPKNHIQRVQIHFRLGKFYFAQKQYSEGLEEFGKILDIHFELLDELHINQPLIAETCMHMGDYYLDMERPIQAFRYFQLAVNLNLDEKLRSLLELQIEICKMFIKNKMDIFNMYDLFASSPGDSHDIRQQQALFYQDNNENILDIVSELRSTDVFFSNFGTTLKFHNTLTLHQMRTLCDFIRNGSNIQQLVFHPLKNRHGICESQEGLKCLADSIAMNDTVNGLYFFQDPYRSQKISKNVRQAFAEAIKVNQTLTHVNFSNFCSPQMTLLLFDALSNYNRTLTDLNISDTKISNKAARNLGEVLKHNKVLTKLVLTRTKLTSSGGKFIASGLDVNENLVYLSLSYNKIRSSGICALGNSLKLNKTLSTLYLDHNRVKSSGVQSIGEALSVNRSLGKLYLHDNDIDCLGATYIAAGLQTNETLSILSLESNNISSVGGVALCDSLRINKTLTSFDISHNSRLLSSIDFAFVKPFYLTILRLNYIHLRDNELRCLVDSLIISVNLLELELHSNEFSADGCTFVEYLLKNNDTLIKLVLSYNELTDIGLKYICEGLGMNKALKTISLSLCMLTDCGMPYISEALKKNKVLTQLILYHNEITEVGVAVLKESLKFNGTLENLKTDNFEIKEKDRYSQLDKNQPNIVQTQESITSVINFLEKNQTEKRLLYITLPENFSDGLLIDNTSNNSIKYIYNENGLCTKHIINDYGDRFVRDGEYLLHRHFLYRKEILKDGNNFFRAVSDCINGNDSRCDFYRECAIGYVKANPKEFYEDVWCLNPLLSIDDYLVKMADSTKPADTLLIRSLCQQLTVNLVIHGSFFGPTFFCVNKGNRDGKQLHLYTSGCGDHFDSVHSYMQPDESSTNVFMSLDQCTEDFSLFCRRFT